MFAYTFILGLIGSGYKLPFYLTTRRAELQNNLSALERKDFVEQEILALLEKGCIEQCEKPAVVNPLTVAESKSKLRLVLDARHINQFV